VTSPHRIEAGPSRAGFEGLWTGLGALALMWPAIINGWPLIFHDTGGYLDRGYLLTLGFGRSLYYGLFLRLFSGQTLGLWPAILAQSLIVSWVIILCLRTQTTRPIWAALVMFILAGLSGLAFFTSQLMPDAFTGVLVLAVYLLAYQRDRLIRVERAALAVLICFACLAHMSHLVLCAGLMLWLGLTRMLGFGPTPKIPLAGILAAIIILPLGNGLIGGSYSATPGASVFVLGRFVQDGLAQQVLDELCPDPRFKLCAFKDQLPHTANDFVWGGEDAPLRQIGGLEGADGEAKALIIESLVRHPLENLQFAAQAAVDQFFLFKTADELGAFMWHTRWRVETLFAGHIGSYDQALQQGQVKPDLNTLDQIHWYAGLSALTLMLCLGLAHDHRIFALSAFILIALIGNAVICGVLSNPQGRYQDRIIWIVFPALFMAGLERFSAWQRRAR
jgi:hypothetical protein